MPEILIAYCFRCKCDRSHYRWNDHVKCSRCKTCNEMGHESC